MPAASMVLLEALQLARPFPLLPSAGVTGAEVGRESMAKYCCQEQEKQYSWDAFNKSGASWAVVACKECKSITLGEHNPSLPLSGLGK